MRKDRNVNCVHGNYTDQFIYPWLASLFRPLFHTLFEWEQPQSRESKEQLWSLASLPDWRAIVGESKSKDFEARGPTQARGPTLWATPGQSTFISVGPVEPPPAPRTPGERRKRRGSRKGVEWKRGEYGAG